VVSFGQVISNDTVIYDLGTVLMFEGYSTNHIKLSAKRTDLEKLGLKGSVKNIQMQTWHWEEYCGHELVKTELYKEIIDFDVNGNRTTGQKTFDGFEVLNYEYERDERGFITKAKVTQPCGQGADAVEYYKYDSLGNVIMERRQDVDGYVWSITNRIFNANGELIREKRALSDDFVVFSEKYERSGKSIKVIDLMSDNIWRGKLNDSGEIVRLVNRRRFQTKEFTYDFDSIGNWTSKIVFLNGKKIMEETRQIQYHSSSHSDVKKEFIVVNIGGQMWMNGNLDVEKFNNKRSVEKTKYGCVSIITYGYIITTLENALLIRKEMEKLEEKIKKMGTKQFLKNIFLIVFLKHFDALFLNFFSFEISVKYLKIKQLRSHNTFKIRL
jgi:hypothetical protein